MLANSKSVRDRLLLAPQDARGRDISRWIGTGFGVIPPPPPGGAQRWLSKILRPMLRPVLQLDEWIPTRIHRFMQTADGAPDLFSIVPTLECAHSVLEWAEEACMSRATLWRKVSRCGASPHQVLGAYCAAVVRKGRSENRTWAELAWLLGYNDAPALHRSIMRRVEVTAARSRRRGALKARKDRHPLP